MDDFFKQINFPYDTIRAGQDDFIKQVYETINLKKNILISAPTGLGKTISGLAPAIYQAKARNMTTVVLTSRQTQANQVIKTILDIQKKSGKTISYTAFIGKRSMCIHQDRDLYPAQDFNEFCKKSRTTGKCGHYINAKSEEHAELRKSIIGTSIQAGMGVEGFVDLCRVNKPDTKEYPKASKCGFCPYELAGEKAFQADVIICDFNYLFQQGIRENFLGKIGRTLEECIVVVDEAHNLPDRIRNAHTYTLSTELLKNALLELKDYVKGSTFDNYIHYLRDTIEEIYFNKGLGDKKEFLITKKEIMDVYNSKLPKGEHLSGVIETLQEVEMKVKEERIISHVGRVAAFLEKWKEIGEEQYLRLLEKSVKQDKTLLSLKIKCIDPSDISSDVVNKTFSTTLMSATLSPITMYRDVLGVANATTLELDSPFSKKNQLTLVIDDVTTKFSARSIDMYKKIANHITRLLNTTEDKNSIVFFPSYDLMQQILNQINVVGLNKKVLREQRYMTKDEKERFVDDFKSNSGFSQKAKVLFAITSGSFAEGLDLPSDQLEMVIVVGLPLGVPDNTTNAIIGHYDKKFKKGQLYGYIYPAMSKIIQAGGRCIRTTNDRGVVVLMDNRFYWPMYAQSFPKNWHLKKTNSPEIEVSNFFDKDDPMSL